MTSDEVAGFGLREGGPIGPAFRSSAAREAPADAIKRTGGVVEAYHREAVREARVVGFAAGVVVGVAWMLAVLFVADRVIG